MKICLKSLTPLLFLALLTYTGCAKQEVVRKDDSIAPAVSTRPVNTTPTAKPADTKSSEKAPLAAANTAPAPVDGQAAGAKSDPATMAAEVQRQLEKVYFDFDSATLSDEEELPPGPAVMIRSNCPTHFRGYWEDPDERKLTSG